MHEGVASAAAKSLQSCLTLQPQRWQPTRLPRPWDSPGNNTGVGSHFLLQCMRVKSESEVAQLCPTLRDPMDCSLPGSSIFQARVLEWGAIAFSDAQRCRTIKKKLQWLECGNMRWGWTAGQDPNCIHPKPFLVLEKAGRLEDKWNSCIDCGVAGKTDPYCNGVRRGRKMRFSTLWTGGWSRGPGGVWLVVHGISG